MGGKAGRALLSWVGDNMAAAVAIAMVLALGAYCWGNISAVPVVQTNLNNLSNTFQSYVTDHTAFSDRHLTAIYHMTDSIDSRLKTLETNDAVKAETLRHIQDAIREIHDVIVPRKK